MKIHQNSIKATSGARGRTISFLTYPRLKRINTPLKQVLAELLTEFHRTGQFILNHTRLSKRNANHLALADASPLIISPYLVPAHVYLTSGK